MKNSEQIGDLVALLVGNDRESARIVAFEKQVNSYTEMLQEIAGTAFTVSNKYSGENLPYRWEITDIEGLKHLGTIQFTQVEILEISAKSEQQQREYLNARYGDLFSGQV